MWEWIQGHVAVILICAVLAAIVVLIIRGLVRDRKKLSGAERRRIQASVPPSCPCGFVSVCAFSVRERVDSAGCVPPWQEPAMAQ